MCNSLSEVLDLGPILAIDDESTVLISGNGAYLNVWVARGGGWDNVDCRARVNDLYETSAADLLDEARAYLAEILAGDSE